MNGFKLPGRNARQFGFTLVELITVMVIVGVLGAFATSRFFSRTDFETRSYADQARSLIRLGQKLAIAQNRPVFVQLSGTGVALCYDATCSAANRVASAGGSNSATSATKASCSGSTVWACEGAPSGVTIQSAATFSFDANGTPSYTAATAFTDLSVSVAGGGQTHNIVISAETGYVY